MIFQQTIIHGPALEAKRYISCELPPVVNCRNYENSSAYASDFTLNAIFALETSSRPRSCYCANFIRLNFIHFSLSHIQPHDSNCQAMI